MAVDFWRQVAGGPMPPTTPRDLSGEIDPLTSESVLRELERSRERRRGATDAYTFNPADQLGPATTGGPYPATPTTAPAQPQGRQLTADERLLQTTAAQLQPGGYAVTTLSDGRQVQIVKDQWGKVSTSLVPGYKATSATASAGGGTQFDYSKTRDYYEGLLGEAEKARQAEADEAEKQRTWQSSEADKERQRQTIADKSAGELQIELARIQKDTTLTAADKQIERERLIQDYARQANEAQLAFERWRAQLQQEEAARDRAAELSIAQGSWGIARQQMQSAERIAVAGRLMDREIAGLQAYSQLLAVESQERSKRAQSAASVFDTLAKLSGQDQLRAAFYTIRGVSPPPSLAANLPAGLLRALDVNPDTARAAAEQLRGPVSVPPWMAKLFGGQAA